MRFIVIDLSEVFPNVTVRKFLGTLQCDVSVRQRAVFFAEKLNRKNFVISAAADFRNPQDIESGSTRLLFDILAFLTTEG